MKRDKGSWLVLVCALVLLGAYIALGVHYDKSGGDPQSFPVFAGVSSWLDEQLESWAAHGGNGE